jgi:GH35 family endo-1,4-beta-xylanase
MGHFSQEASMKRSFLALMTLLLAGPLSAQAPPGGKSMFEKTGQEALKYGYKEGFQQNGKVEKVKVEGQSFKEALRLTTLATSENPWDIQVHAICSQPIAAGDVLLAEFWVRATDTKVEIGEASSEFGFERFGEPWTKTHTVNLAIGQGWKKYSIPFKATETLAAGGSQAYFRMGYKPQAFELADFKLTHYGTKVKLEDLAATKITYNGAEPDAPWRKQAQERIERERKGDLKVTVTDPSGKPVPNAKVSVRMKRHEYGFGSAVVAKLLSTPGLDNDRYQKEVERLFNIVVYENDLKWGMWEDGAPNTGYWRRQYVDDSMKWLQDRGIRVRGHNMVWGSWRWMPGNIKALKDDKKALAAAIEKRIADVGGTMAGKLVDWDVVNESHTEKDLTDIFGKEGMVTWFKLAKKADPKARLFLNDYPGPDTIGHLDGFEKDLKFLVEKGAPLEGVGLQGHVGGTPWSIPAYLGVLDRFGALGKPIVITEYDTGIKDLELDAAFTRDFLTATFSHPSTDAFLMWGFWDGAHWHSQAPMFNKDWTLKASGKAYEDLVFKDWWTNASGSTAADGTYSTRGFRGDYEVTVTAGGKTAKAPAKIVKDGAELSVVLK